VVLLLKHRVNTHILDRRTRITLIHIAASKNATPGIISILIGSSIQVESQDNLGRTPLQVAAKHSYTRVVRLLLNLGANPNFKNNNQYQKGWSALFYAATNPSIPGNGRKSIIRTLFLHKAKIDAKNHAQKSPLLHAISVASTRCRLYSMPSLRAPFNRRNLLLNVVPVLWLQMPMENRSSIWLLLHRAVVPV
jgi:ankyrin repeat protein